MLHTKQDNPSSSLLKRICSSEHKKINTAPLEWGKTNEDTAHSGYSRQQKEGHTGFSCTAAGLVVNLKYPYLGATPDGWVEYECCGRGIVEIKCPYSYQSTHPYAINERTFYLQHSSDQLKLDPKHKYHYQVQMQLSICEVNYCDFVVWTLAGMANIRVDRFEAFFTSCLLQELDPTSGSGLLVAAV